MPHTLELDNSCPVLAIIDHIVSGIVFFSFELCVIKYLYKETRTRVKIFVKLEEIMLKVIKMMYYHLI